MIFAPRPQASSAQPAQVTPAQAQQAQTQAGLTRATLSRADRSALGQWWWTVDRLLLGAILLLMILGLFLVQAAGPAVALRVGVESWHFFTRHALFLLPALAIIFLTSLLTPAQIKKLALFVLLISLLLVVITLFSGVEIKGARRWLFLGGFSLQPSEFLKPSLAVCMAWLMAQPPRLVMGSTLWQPQGNLLAHALYALAFTLLIAQPDLGMSAVITAIWLTLFFLNGMPKWVLLLLMGAAPCLGIAAYQFFPHAQSRIDRFLNPDSGDNFQVQRAQEAFINGGLLGTGPGQGTVKMSVPDAHTDFIFAVMGEELGLIWCAGLVLLFAFMVVRGLMRARKETDLFTLLAVSGLLVQFGLQAFINLGSTLHLLPTKGMTLPFISYGGSSLWALSLGMGMILALTRQRYGNQVPVIKPHKGS